MVTQFSTFHAIPILLPCSKRSANAYSLTSAEYSTSPNSLRTCVLSSSVIILRREMYPKTHNSYSNNGISYLPLKFLSHFNIGGSAPGETASSFLSRRNRIILDRECFPKIRDKLVREACSTRILLQPGDNFTKRISESGRCAVCGVLWRCLTLHLLLS